MSFNESELWFLVQLREKRLVVFSEKDSFSQESGTAILNKMIPPDTYYEKFCEDARFLPWIPDN